MMRWSTACPDWERRIIKGESLIPFPPLFPTEAHEAMRIFEDLLIVDAPGSPRIGDACRPWVLDFARAVFGSYDAQSGRRLIREYFLSVAKKNAKSTIAAGIMLTALLRNWRESGEFMILAPTIEIANNSFGPAHDMIRKDEELQKLLDVSTHERLIRHRNTKATLKVVAAADDTVGGKKTIGLLVDEVWQFGLKPNASSMLREAMGGHASRPEGFAIYLTTQSSQPPAGVYKEKLDYFRDVRDGLIDDNASLPVLYEFPESMLKAGQHRVADNFYITNPNLGASVDLPFLLREMAKAERVGEAELNDFLAKHLNVQIGQNMRNGRWAGADHWPSSVDASITLETIMARCDVITVAVDGGGLDDLLGLCVLGKDRVTDRWLSWVRAWVHPVALARRKSIASELADYAKAGDLVMVDTIGQDVREVADLIARIRNAGKLGGIGLDPYGIGDIPAELRARGIEGDTQYDGQPGPLVMGIPQGWKINAAIKTAERGLAAGTIAHADQALMSWCVGNAKAEAKGNATSITKQMAGTGKIDPLIAFFMAVEVMTRNPEPVAKSFWETMAPEEA
ncbi:terminase large subunit [Rhodovarius crocodyli]|nr:terminase large subunit [Rhodovarius crocodyli]